MDLVGYVTLAEANEYVSTHYISTDDLRVAWEKLTEDDQKALLTKSFQNIELLPFTGKKFERGQLNAFPRWPSNVVPDAIKWAQIENAIVQCDPSNLEDAKYYERLWMYGVESYSIGNLSERTSTGTYKAQATGVTSVLADRLLRPYLGGGYRM